MATGFANYSGVLEPSLRDWQLEAIIEKISGTKIASHKIYTIANEAGVNWPFSGEKNDITLQEILNLSLHEASKIKSYGRGKLKTLYKCITYAHENYKSPPPQEIEELIDGLKTKTKLTDQEKKFYYMSHGILGYSRKNRKEISLTECVSINRTKQLLRQAHRKYSLYIYYELIDDLLKEAKFRIWSSITHGDRLKKEDVNATNGGLISDNLQMAIAINNYGQGNERGFRSWLSVWLNRNFIADRQFWYKSSESMQKYVITDAPGIAQEGFQI